MTKICRTCGKEKTIGQFAGYSRQCLECSREYQRKRQQTHNRLRFGYALKTKYRISVDLFDKMLIEQSGRCAICSEPLETPNVDHDHDTRKVRGLLCFNCNRGLGHFADNPELLEEAARYLRAHKRPEGVSRSDLKVVVGGQRD